MLDVEREGDPTNPLGRRGGGLTYDTRVDTKPMPKYDRPQAIAKTTHISAQKLLSDRILAWSAMYWNTSMICAKRYAIIGIQAE